MANITSQLDAVRAAESFVSLKEAIADALNAINSSKDGSETIVRIQTTLKGLSEKLDSINVTSNGEVSFDNSPEFLELKELVKKINNLLAKKADLTDVENLNQKTYNYTKEGIDRVNSIIDKKADKTLVDEFKNEIDTKTTEMEKSIANKADKSSVNSLKHDIASKADSSTVEKALSLKADASTVNQIANSQKVPSLNTVMLKSAPLTRGGNDDDPFIGDDDDDENENVSLSRLYQIVNGKVEQTIFDEIVGNGFNTWTITDYIIRLKEDYHTALENMMTREAAEEVIDEGVERVESIIEVNGESTDATKMDITIDPDSEEFELITLDDLELSLSDYKNMFTFTWEGPFESGTVDEHGWKSPDEYFARTGELLGARDFEVNLNSKYAIKVVTYDEYKLILDSTDWLTGKVSYDNSDFDGSTYLRIIVKKVDESAMTPEDIEDLTNDVTLTMFGVDWTGENANKPVDISIVKSVSDRVNTLEGKQISNEGRLNTLETNTGTMDHDIEDLYGRLVTTNNILENKVAMLSYSEDGMVYFWADEEKTNLIGSIGPLVSGSGSWNGQGGGTGGGGGTNNAEISLRNTTGWITTTISDSDSCAISFDWASTEDDIPTGEGSLTVYVNGSRRITKGIQQGENTITISNNYLNSGRNVIRIAVSDIYENTRYINYTVNRASLYIRSSFDASTPYSGAFVFPYILTGDVDKTVYIEMDGEVIHTEETSVSERQLTYEIPAQTHGTHVLRAWYTAEVNGEVISSNVLRYEVICIAAGSTTPIITSTFNTSSVEQYTNIVIKYRVYDPRNLTASVVLSANGRAVNTITVDRTEQTWSFRADTPGSLTLSIRCESTVKTFDINVTENSAQIGAVTEGLELFLSSQGRSNGEADPSEWTYEDISATLTDFNYVTNGWVHDAEDNVVMRVNGGARVTIPLKIFARDFRNTGKTIEFEFATRYVRNYDTPIISCMSGNRGLSITSQKATLKSEQMEISTQFKEDEHVRIAFVVEKRSESRIVYIYIDGIMSGTVPYPDGDDFSQISPVDITIGCDDSTVDIYNIRVYDTDLTRQQVLTNWISDTQNVDLMLSRYNRNNVFDNYGNIVINKLPESLPYMILNSEGTHLPQYKGDKVTISGEYVNKQNTALSYQFNDAQFDVQGTSSQYYERKNYKAKYKNGVIVNGATKSSYAMTVDGMPAKVFCFKKDVASSEGANNVELVRLYDEAIRSVYLTPAQEEDPRIREGIDGYPMVIFENNGISTKFVGKYNHNFDKGAENVFGFVDDDESWEVKNNTSDRVLFISDDFTGSAWEDDFEARYPDEDPAYTDIAQLSEFVSFVKSTNTEAATGASLGGTVNYGGVDYTTDTAEYRLAKFKAEIGNYVEMNSMLFFYLFTELFLMVDNRAKNMFPSFMGSEVN